MSLQTPNVKVWHSSCPFSMLHKTTGCPRLALLLTTLFRSSQNLVPRHQMNFPRTRKTSRFGGISIDRPTATLFASLCSLRTSFGLLLHDGFQTHFVSISNVTLRCTNSAYSQVWPQSVCNFRCPKIILYSINKLFTNLGKSWWMNSYNVLHYRYASLWSASLGDVVVVRTSYSVLTQTQTVQFSLLHTYAIRYSLLLLGYKPVQHVTVLNTVGNCTTVVSIVM